VLASKPNSCGEVRSPPKWIISRHSILMVGLWVRILKTFLNVFLWKYFWRVRCKFWQSCFSLIYWENIQAYLSYECKFFIQKLL